MWIAFFIWVADADAVPFPEEVPDKDGVPDEVEVVSKLKIKKQRDHSGSPEIPEHHHIAKYNSITKTLNKT